MQLKPINEQVVVVFGASSGIGRDVALKLAERGARVVAAARGEMGLSSLMSEIRGRGGEAIAIVADASDFDKVKMVAERAVDKYGRLDTWVQMAAVSIYAKFEETTPEEWRRIMDVNLTGQAHGAWAALPHLKRSGGALICVSSVEALRALPLQSAYAASKHGVKGFVDALRVELINEGAPVSVTNIMPASINTPFFNKARTKTGYKPMGIPPIYSPHIVAEAILYAAENPARDIICGGAGWGFKMGEFLAPSLLDKALSKIGFEWQRTDERKSEDAPDNLFHPLEGYDRVEGDFSNQTMPASAYTWLERHPLIRGTLTAATLGALAFVAARKFMNGSQSNEAGEEQEERPAITTTNTQAASA